MKRGKDDDKIMGPMFPRLHVNDTEKGGPRAPPRNKMALYEQLTIPSQRYNSGAMPLNPNDSGSSVSSTSASQDMGYERNMHFPLYQLPLAPADEIDVRHPEAVTLTNQLAQSDNRKKPVEEDDLMVPIFTQPGSEPCNGESRKCIVGERSYHLSLSHSAALPDTGHRETNQSNSREFISRHHVIIEDGRSLRVSDVPTRDSLDLTATKNDDAPWREDTCIQQPRLSSLEQTDQFLCQDHEDTLLAVDSRYGEGASDQPLESINKEISSRVNHNPRIGCGHRGGNEIDNGMQRIEGDHSSERENLGRGDDVHETSILDSLSGLGLSPDDVVGVIGQNQFWKARNAIVNQQRAFAGQVFELHRLIKVQKGFALSPHLLLEASAFVGKSSLKCSKVKNYSSDHQAYALSHTICPKDSLLKLTDKIESTAENAGANAPAPFRSSNTDPEMNPWSFHQPAPHQWLVPVMSPSEGLVYKPFPAPGFMDPPYDGCGPVGPTPIVGNSMNPTYGGPTHYYYPGIPFGGQWYVPAYGTAMTTPAMDRTSQGSVPDPFGQTGLDMLPQGSSNVPGQKNGTEPATRAMPRKEGGLQGSPSIAHVTPKGSVTEGRDFIPFFPTGSEGAAVMKSWIHKGISRSYFPVYTRRKTAA